MERHILPLPGCTCEPLLSYLKALGVLRLLGEQKDFSSRGFWQWGTFTLQTELDKEALLSFFLHEYRPSPIITPWNSASGFWGGAPSKLLDEFVNSTNPRLEAYAGTITATRLMLRSLGIKGKPSAKEKPLILQRMRAELLDSVVDWLDALSALTEEKLIFAPLLGTGGNDGRLEFAVNYMQHLCRVIPFENNGWPTTSREDPALHSRAWLIASLYNEGSPSLLSASTGQFHPGGVGGPNATQGFEGDAIVNPWDYVLMIEGALLLAGSVARRTSLSARQTAAFPFTVRPSPGGWHTIANLDSMTARQELWMPLWEKPAALTEVAHLLKEGRAQVGKRSAATGSDFARAVASLGVDRGLSSFVRFAFFRRSGKSYIASPLGHMPVQFRLNIDLLEEADPWLRRIRIVAQRNESPESLRRAFRTVENAVFTFCREGQPRNLQRVLESLSKVEHVIARNKSLQEKLEPLQSLSLKWLDACNDDTTEFYLARSLASICGVYEPQGKMVVPSLRAYLEPVKEERPGRFTWDLDSTTNVWGGEDLTRNLLAIIIRRCLDTGRFGLLEHAPLNSHYAAGFSDVSMYLNKQTDDARVASLLQGLVLLRWPTRPRGVLKGFSYAPPDINRLYALCKLFFHHKSLPLTEEAVERAKVIRPSQEILAHLKLDDNMAVIRYISQRLNAAGLKFLGTTGGRHKRLPELNCPRGMGSRVASSLLFPVANLEPLMRLVLR